MAEFIYIEALSIEGKVDTPHKPLPNPHPDENPYLSSMAIDERAAEEE